MRTTLAIKEDLLEEVKALSGVKTKKEAVERALEEFIRRRKAKKLLDYEGKMELSYTLSRLIERRRKDVPHR
jgi:Arc/MetJ family transcription regulator